MIKTHISKFESMLSFTPNDVLKPYDITTNDIDKAIHIIEKYSLDNSLLRDLKSSQVVGYRNLRSWKVKSFIKRYKVLEPMIEEVITVDDYMLELMDEGFKVKINPFRKEIDISFLSEDVIKRMNRVTEFLIHVSKRMEIKFVRIYEDKHTLDYNFYEFSVLYKVIPY